MDSSSKKMDAFVTVISGITGIRSSQTVDKTALLLYREEGWILSPSISGGVIKTAESHGCHDSEILSFWQSLDRPRSK